MKIIGLLLSTLELIVYSLKLYPAKYTTYFKALIVTFKFIVIIYTGKWNLVVLYYKQYDITHFEH